MIVIAPALPVTGSRPGVADRVVVLGLGAAVAYAALAQGGFYGRQAVTVLVLVAVAAVARVLTRRPVGRAVAIAAACWVLFAGWALVSGLIHADVGAAVPTAAVACGLAASALAASGLLAESRRILLSVVLAVAAVVALSCWVGVALHLEPLALPSSGLWRASSTITYANATAAFLVVALVLAVTVVPPGLLTNGLAAVLLLGLATTMSRAGALGLVVAAVVCAFLVRDVARWRRFMPVLPAVAVAFVGLLPSLPVGGAAQPLPALAGLVVGAAVLVVGGRLRLRHLALVAVLAVALLLVLPTGRGLVGHAAAGIATTRLTATSDERADLTRVTAAQFWSSPLTGVGPGLLNLHYVDHTGAPVHAQYTHDEFLQTATETGVVGLALALAGAVALAAGAVRRRTPEAAAALAILAGFAVHSAFDFLWHVPVLPLLMTLAVASLTTDRQEHV